MAKEQIIRPIDAKEYISFQFRGLIQTLEQFDYREMAGLVRATHDIFEQTDSMLKKDCSPDCILLETATNLK